MSNVKTFQLTLQTHSNNSRLHSEQPPHLFAHAHFVFHSRLSLTHHFLQAEMVRGRICLCVCVYERGRDRVSECAKLHVQRTFIRVEGNIVKPTHPLMISVYMCSVHTFTSGFGERRVSSSSSSSSSSGTWGFGRGRWCGSQSDHVRCTRSGCDKKCAICNMQAVFDMLDLVRKAQQQQQIVCKQQINEYINKRINE